MKPYVRTHAVSQTPVLPCVQELPKNCCGSSVGEHIIGNDEVGSSILPRSTIFRKRIPDMPDISTLKADWLSGAQFIFLRRIF